MPQNDTHKKRKTPHLKLSYLYARMTDSILKNPKHSKFRLKTFQNLMLSSINSQVSLLDAFDCLNNIIEKRPELSDQIIDVLIAQTQKDTSRISKYILHCLGHILEVHPSSADKVFECMRLNFNSFPDSDRAVEQLEEFFNQKPDYDESVLSILSGIISKPDNHLISSTQVEGLLKHIVVVGNKPELSLKVFKILENLSGRTAISYDILNHILRTNPELTDNIIASLKNFGSHKKNISFVSSTGIFKNILKIKPEAKEAVFEIFHEILQPSSPKEVQNAYFFLHTAEPFLDQNLSMNILTFLDKHLLSDSTVSSFLETTYPLLSKIFQEHPAMEDKVLEVFEKALSSNHNYFVTLKIAYDCLGDMAKHSPQHADKILDLMELGLQSKHTEERSVRLNNDSNSLQEAYNVLSQILKRKPEASHKVFKLFEEALQSYANSSSSLHTAYWCLEDIAQNYPQYTNQIYRLIKTGIRSFDNDTSSFRLACRCLADVVIPTSPNLAEDALDFIVHHCSDMHDDKPKLLVYKSCLKHIPMQEMVARYPDLEQDFIIAHKARFSSSQELKYAMEFFSRNQLANSMILSAQQHAMNVLMSVSAQDNNFSKEEALAFRKPDASEKVKEYIKNNSDWLIPASFKAASAFREYFPAYIKMILNHNKSNPEDKLSVHDAVYWLPEPMSRSANEHFTQFIQKNMIYQNAEHKMVHRPLRELKIIAQNWKVLEDRVQKNPEHTEISKLKYSDILAICQSAQYTNQKNDAFAAEAAKNTLPEAWYSECESIYLAGLKVPEPFDSKKEFKVGKYVGRFLPRQDVRVGFFGDYTDCCQHFHGAGNSCAVSSIKHPFSQLFVIEDDKGKIIAGSWTWENTEGKYREVCFDNIESLGELQLRPEINEIYEQVGTYLAQEQNCRRVTIGLGYQDADVSKYQKTTDPIALPSLYGKDASGHYSDAQSQVLLTENPNAKPLNHNQESQRYIRDVCFLDETAMDVISETCFPDSDKQLSKPDDLDGFVIEDREKGVVGYCLYDRDEKEIYDMAVLPEYRKDRNASSGKLLLEMMKTIKEQGGQWKAQLRDETTLRYMEVMEQRGVIKMQKHGLDHEMSDGSKVIDVTFTVIPENLRAVKEKITDKTPHSDKPDIQPVNMAQNPRQITKAAYE